MHAHTIVIQSVRWLLSVILLLVSIPAVEATTITATASGNPVLPSPQQQETELDESILRMSGNVHNREFDRETEEVSTWTFDFSTDPNFTSIMTAGSLKSAVLTLKLAPQSIHIPLDTSPLPSRASGTTALNATTKVEIELLDVYSKDDLLTMLAESGGKLPIAYPDPTQIKAVEIQFSTEVPDVWIPILLSALVLLSGIATIVVIRRRRQKLLEARMAALGKMTSTVIHDVKNSFAAIQSCAEVMADEALDSESRKDFAQLLVSEIARGVDMTQEVLEFSRGHSRPMHFQLVTLDSFVNGISSIVKTDLAQRRIELRTRLEYCGEICVDIKRMKRVFLNLITNAKEAMPDGGALTISSRRVEHGVELEFTDTGCGMTPELQARMFDPLVTEGKSNGTGLGMTIVKEILTKHHARIEVKSTVGKGTTIQVSLPC